MQRYWLGLGLALAGSLALAACQNITPPAPTASSRPPATDTRPPPPTAAQTPTRPRTPTVTLTQLTSRTPTDARTQAPEWPGRDLVLQSQGDDVELVQTRLIDLGYLEAGGADGWYGPVTEQAVRNFQANNGLTDDGIVGPVTWKRLFSAGPLPASVTRTLSPTWTPSATPKVIYPRVDGSTSTLPLQVILACKQFEVSYEWREGMGERLVFVEPDTRATLSGWPEPDHTGTHQAYINLINGKTDFILVAREPSADELNEAQARGVMLETSAVALDAFVFLVNWQSPVTSLTVEQVRGIYAGQITDWAEVGGPAGRISPYQRDRNSGSQELMDKLVMQGLPMVAAPEMLLYDMFGPLNMVGQDSLGIGYSVYYYTAVIAPWPPTFKLIKIEGIQPTSETIAQRTYPLLSEVYAVVRAGTPADDPALRLRDWVLSEAGQAAVAESGYVPIR